MIRKLIREAVINWKWIGQEGQENQFRLLRESAYAVSLANYREAYPLLRLCAIDAQALSAFQTAWENHPQRKVSWDWPAEMIWHRANNPDRFELAVWYGTELCGLAVARPSKMRTLLTLFGLEGAPHKHSLKGFILDIVTATVGNYGRLLNVETLKVLQPVEGAVATYLATGYKPVFDRKGKVLYLTLSIGD